MAGSSLVDVCRFRPTAGGTTDWTFSAAVTGYQSPAAAAIVNGAQYSYRAESSDLSQWEIGQGTYNTGTGVLARTTVLFNSSGGTSKINFNVAPQVAIVALAEDIQKVITTLSNSIGADVLLNNITTFFDGPSVAQGTTGTWFASGSVTLTDTANATMLAKLWDGTTVVDSGVAFCAAAGRVCISLSGVFTNPAGNIRISCEDGTNTTGKILFNLTSFSKDSTITVLRIA